MFNEGLSAKPRINRHYKHHINIANDIRKKADRSRWVKCNATLHAGLMNLINRTMEMGAGFVVNRHHVSAQRSNLLDITFGVNNHQMNVEGLTTSASHCLENRKAEGDIGDEDTVHYIQMKPIGRGDVNHLYVIGQMKEIGSQQ